MKINLNTIKQYEDIFGTEKIRFLFNEYKNKIDTDIPKIDEYITTADRDSLRMVYHSLASASLVFGMDNFGNLCREIENFIIDGSAIEDLYNKIENGYKLLENDIKQVESYLEKPDE